ncbi:MAG: hypothetical protein M0Q38_00330 [Bacteroidales bacterium]|nr:hypothetical protein [Bacteroidales bacterium]
MQLSLFWSKPRITKSIPETDFRVIRSTFDQRIPDAALPIILSLIHDDNLQLKITPHRSSKSGDFRAAHGKYPARISVNGNLNQYAFLITLIHELAHYHTWRNHRHPKHILTLCKSPQPRPHGKEWKNQFHSLMQPFLNEAVFPNDILPLLRCYLENPKASTGADHLLSRALLKYDPSDQTLCLDELPPNAVFTINGKRRFRKKELVRKRYKCICLGTNRVYLVSPLAPVRMIDDV